MLPGHGVIDGSAHTLLPNGVVFAGVALTGASPWRATPGALSPFRPACMLGGTVLPSPYLRDKESRDIQASCSRSCCLQLAEPGASKFLSRKACGSPLRPWQPGCVGGPALLGIHICRGKPRFVLYCLPCCLFCPVPSTCARHSSVLTTQFYGLFGLGECGRRGPGLVTEGTLLVGSEAVEEQVAGSLAGQISPPPPGLGTQCPAPHHPERQSSPWGLDMQGWSPAKL